MAKSQVERRRTKRRPILQTFSVFVALPKKGGYRLALHDVSDHGLAFDLDTEGESPTDFPLKPGDEIEARFYINQSLYIPLRVKLVRIEEDHQIRRAGTEIVDQGSANHQAFVSFVHMLDSIADVAQLEESAH